MIVKYSRTSESRDLAFIRSRMDWDTRLDNSVRIFLLVIYLNLCVYYLQVFKWVEGFNS